MLPVLTEGHQSDLAEAVQCKLANVCRNPKLFYSKTPTRKSLLINNTANSILVKFTHRFIES